jgi:hypothetical protein
VPFPAREVLLSSLELCAVPYVSSWSIDLHKTCAYLGRSDGLPSFLHYKWKSGVRIKFFVLQASLTLSLPFISTVVSITKQNYVILLVRIQLSRKIVRLPCSRGLSVPVPWQLLQMSYDLTL